MYMFVIPAVPSAKNVRCAHLKSARVHIWVNTSGELEALRRANAYISDYEWIPSDPECALEIQEEQIPHLGISESQLRNQALRFGIAAHFLAVPIEQDNANAPVYLERLKRPNP